MGKTISCLILAVFFVAAGRHHFAAPAAYLAIMPPALPWHRELVALSGVAEIFGGLGVLWPRTRVLAGWGLMALLVAVFPANVQAALQGMEIGGVAVPQWLLWVRLPLQGALLAWVYGSCRPRRV